MHAFRFNPVFKQWVLLGAPSRSTHQITSAHLVGHAQGELQSATCPRQPFVLDPQEQKLSQDHLLHQQEAAVGEYELLLWKAAGDCFEWNAEQWDAWLLLLQTRLIQLQRNPYLHYVYCILMTRLQDTTDEYVRVGDIVATSHPIAGEEVEISAELREKMLHKEPAFTVLHYSAGSVFIPSAPLHAQEVWVLPSQAHGGIEHVAAKERQEVGKILAGLCSSLRTEFPDTPYVLKIHTSFTAEKGWWIQLYKEDSSQESPVPMRPFPEPLVAQLRSLLKG